MKKIFKVLLILIMLTVIMSGLSYIGLAYYYKDTYSYGTFINGTYATGRTPEELNELFTRGNDYDRLSVRIADRTYDIEAEDIDYKIDYLGPLRAYKDMQNPYLWITNILDGMKNREIGPTVYYDKDKLEAYLRGFNIERLDEPYVCEIEYSEDGYVLIDNKDEQYDEVKCIKAIEDSLNAGKLYVIVGDDCRKDVVYTDEELADRSIYGMIDRYHMTGVNIHIADEVVTLNNAELDRLLVRDAEGMPVVNADGTLLITKESVYDGLKDVVSPYNDYNNHYFTTHDGRVVHLTKGTLGNSVNVNTITDDVYEGLISGEMNIGVELEYTRRMNEKEQESADTIGNTYIEIDLDNQRMYFYKDGELKVNTNVVTGTHATGQDTPEGVYYIYNMKRNTYLVGENYRCFVYTWMPIVRGVGIHDATWRKLWESDTYLRNGSHGCINTPLEEARYIYDNAYVGLPVIVYSYAGSVVD